MTAAILTIGTELTRGELVDTNGPWLADELTGLGFEVVRMVTVGDDLAELVAAIASVSGLARVVVATGGLGPTSDDRTAEAAARLLEVPLVRDAAALDRIRAIYRARDREMPPSNEKQADFPEGAALLENETGTAPGFQVHLPEEDTDLFFLPGVPSEMRAMFAAQVAPRVASLAPRTTHQVHLRTFGLTESEAATLLADVESQFPAVSFGYRATFPEIEVKVLARAESEAEAERLAEEAATAAREALGDVVYGDRDDTFAGSVGRSLRDRGLTLAVAESCTGGLVGAMLTDVPGSSDYLLLDAVVYANGAKRDVLGVGTEVLRAHGAVSPETARAMAEGAARVAGADLAVSITGIAGPGGGTEDKPVGTVFFGVAGPGRESRTVRRLFHGDRDRVRRRAAYFALDLVRRAARGDRLPD